MKAQRLRLRSIPGALPAPPAYMRSNSSRMVSSCLSCTLKFWYSGLYSRSCRAQWNGRSSTSPAAAVLPLPKPALATSGSPCTRTTARHPRPSLTCPPHLFPPLCKVGLEHLRSAEALFGDVLHQVVQAVAISSEPVRDGADAARGCRRGVAAWQCRVTSAATRPGGEWVTLFRARAGWGTTAVPWARAAGTHTGHLGLRLHPGSLRCPRRLGLSLQKGRRMKGVGPRWAQ